MIRALYSAASGMKAQETNVDNISNNLANANTVGYKMRRAQFQDLMYQSLVQPGTAAGQQTVVPTGLQLGLGTRASSNEIVFPQGAFPSTARAKPAVFSRCVCPRVNWPIPGRANFTPTRTATS